MTDQKERFEDWLWSRTGADSKLETEEYAASSLGESLLWPQFELALIDLPMVVPLAKAIGEVGEKYRPDDKRVQFVAGWGRVPETVLNTYWAGVRSIFLPQVFRDGRALIDVMVREIYPAETEEEHCKILREVAEADTLTEHRRRWLEAAQDFEAGVGTPDGLEVFESAIRSMTRLSWLSYERTLPSPDKVAYKTWMKLADSGWGGSPALLNEESWGLRPRDSRGVTVTKTWTPAPGWTLVKLCRKLYCQAAVSMDISAAVETLLLADVGGREAAKLATSGKTEGLRDALMAGMQQAKITRELFEQRWGGDSQSSAAQRLAVIDPDAVVQLGRGLLELGMYIEHSGADTGLEIPLVSTLIATACALCRHGLGMRASLVGEDLIQIRETVASHLMLALSYGMHRPEDPGDGMCYSRLFEGLGLSVLQSGAVTMNMEHIEQFMISLAIAVAAVFVLASEEDVALSCLVGDPRLASKVGIEFGAILRDRGMEELFAMFPDQRGKRIMESIKMANFLVRVGEQMRVRNEDLPGLDEYWERITDELEKLEKGKDDEDDEPALD